MTDSHQTKVDAGIAKATTAAPEHLKDEADRILRHVLKVNRYAHAGLFWSYVHDHESELYEPLRKHSYMVNGRWSYAARRGLCKATPHRTPTFLASAHQKNTLWESRIYQP